MLISSNDLLGTARVAATGAANTIEAVRNGGRERPLADLRFIEGKLTQALAEVRAARWGIERKAPQFDDRDLDLLIEREVIAIHSAHGHIPKAGR